MTDSIAKISNAVKKFGTEEIAIIKSTVAKGTTDTELAFFLFAASKYGLDPIKKEIWCYKDSRGNMIVFASRDGFLTKAQENPKYAGIQSCEICEKDEFEINIPEAKVNHKITTFQRGNILGAYAIVHRKDSNPTIEIVDFKTYDKGFNTWKTHPAEMIKKVAEVHALKKAFGISGLQAEEDFEVVGDKAYPVTNPDQVEIWKVSEIVSRLDFVPLSDDERESIRVELENKISLVRLDEIYKKIMDLRPEPIESGMNYGQTAIQNKLDLIDKDERK
jgi:phage recombination protein Bet